MKKETKPIEQCENRKHHVYFKPNIGYCEFWREYENRFYWCKNFKPKQDESN